jgi:hypothetical protein
MKSDSYNKTNEMHQFLKFIFGMELYMFRTGFLSIIRSLVLYTQQGSGSGWNCVPSRSR